ncbi:MAG TPA: hypothetical protein PKG49_08905 [Nitrosomonas mobilis]|nr:hypothetical protein [Nitrosomonas mobilis]
MRISRDELVVLSVPGPDSSIRLEDFVAGRAVSRRYRSRRIGEFFKEQELTEGRSTGVPEILKAMATNGPPAGTSVSGGAGGRDYRTRYRTSDPRSVEDAGRCHGCDESGRNYVRARTQRRKVLSRTLPTGRNQLGRN